MTLCDDGHEEICYDQRGSCPICNLIDQKDEEIESLKDLVSELREQIEELERQ